MDGVTGVEWVDQAGRLEARMGVDAFPLEVVQAAAWRLTDRCAAFLDRLSDGRLRVVLRPAGEPDAGEITRLARAFLGELRDESLRHHLERVRGKDREAVLFRALAGGVLPEEVERLLRELDNEDALPDPAAIPVPWEVEGGR